MGLGTCEQAVSDMLMMLQNCNKVTVEAVAWGWGPGRRCLAAHTWGRAPVSRRVGNLDCFIHSPWGPRPCIGDFPDAPHTTGLCCPTFVCVPFISAEVLNRAALPLLAYSLLPPALLHLLSLHLDRHHCCCCSWRMRMRLAPGRLQREGCQVPCRWALLQEEPC
jgi:hypothetical protein